LLALGFWQLDRADQKRMLQAEYDRLQKEPALVVRPVVEAPDTLRYRTLRVRGHYDTRFQFLLDNRVHQGRAGYYVLTPIRIEGSDVRILVNRGWIAGGVDRNQLPGFSTPTEPVEVVGTATVPHGKEFRLGPAKPPGKEWSEVWQYLDLRVYQDSVNFPVQPAVILLDPSSTAGGFVRQWGRLDAGIQTHLGYAMTWFSLAAALLAIYILVNTRRK